MEDQLPILYEVEVNGKKLKVVEHKYYVVQAKRVMRLLDLLTRATMWPTKKNLEAVEDALPKRIID